MMPQSTANPSFPFGKFDIAEQIGRGGMATVHRAFLRGVGGFRRQIVIKRILDDLAVDEGFVQMFIEEAKLSARLDHPNIVSVYDFGNIDGTYFLAMEYIEGVTLKRLLGGAAGPPRPLDPGVAMFIAQQICLGLQHAHTLCVNDVPAGLVHRDISPTNVMISTHGVVKVLDFGIARCANTGRSELTPTGTVRGNCAYLSPEQLQQQPATKQSDIFSTGILLWEMLTGRRLFKGRSIFLTAANVVSKPIPPVTALRPGLPKQLDTICALALDRNPQRRYFSAMAMADDLERQLVRSGFNHAQLVPLVQRVLLAHRSHHPEGHTS